eukprot:8672975-Pyramimonas_sp.AAC.1
MTNQEECQSKQELGALPEQAQVLAIECDGQDASVPRRQIAPRGYGAVRLRGYRAVGPWGCETIGPSGYWDVGLWGCRGIGL